MKKIFIGSDKSGFALKEAVKAYLKENDFDVTDIGTTDEEKPFPYYEVAQTGALKIQNKELT